MALARIITRSEACSRELAADLLSRGYTVEVVAPDAVPNHKADLELRVEAKSGERLTANVIVRDGERTASLDFDRDLSAPAVRHTTPGADTTSPSFEQVLPVVSARADRRDESGVLAVTKPGATFDDQNTLFPMSSVNRWHSESDASAGDLRIASGKIARPAISSPTARRQVIASAATDRPLLDQSAFNKTLLNQTVFQESRQNRTVLSERAVEKVSPQPEVFKVPFSATIMSTSRKFVAAGMGALKAGVAAVKAHRFSDRGRSRFGIAAASLASVGLLLALAFGLRPGKTDSATSTHASAPSASSVISSGMNDSNAGNPAKSPLPLASKKSEAKPALAANAATSNMAVTKTSAPQLSKSQMSVSARNRSSATRRDLRRHTEDLIARDTVTYLDRPGKTAALKSGRTAQPAEAISRTRTHRNGEIAENTVTYLNGMTPPSARPAAKSQK